MLQTAYNVHLFPIRQLKAFIIWLMATLEDLKKLGVELRTRREERGETLRAFASRVGVSHQHLSQIERGYVSPNRGRVIPTDETLEKLAKALDVPLSRLHGLLGRTPDVPFPAFDDPEAVRLADRYVKLPKIEREAVLDVVAAIEAMVAKRDQKVDR